MHSCDPEIDNKTYRLNRNHKVLNCTYGLNACNSITRTIHAPVLKRLDVHTTIYDCVSITISQRISPGDVVDCTNKQKWHSGKTTDAQFS